MKRTLLDLLACPLCKGMLKFTLEEERDGEVLSASLDCSGCNVRYSIFQGIPNLLPPDLRES